MKKGATCCAPTKLRADGRFASGKPLRVNLNVLWIDDAFRRTLLDCQLDLTNGAGDFDTTRASGCAVVDRPAAPHAIGIRQRIEAFLCPLIAVIENEAMRLNNRRRADILAVP